MKVTWVKISHGRKYGGQAYADKAKELIKKHFDFEEVKISSKPDTFRYIKPLYWMKEISKIGGYSDVWVLDSFIVVAFANLNNMGGKKVILLHHIDHSVFPIAIRQTSYFLEKVFHYKAKKSDAIVVVSDYWKDYFLTKGYNNVRVIHNSFDAKNFYFTHEEIEQFKKAHGFDGRPIVYIGNCLKAKGVIESYDALKELNVNLVTSGEKTVNIPARNLNLEYKDYLKLLKSSAVVVTMSKFKEGWCSTAHEAMLCKTPVIGSGLGGMKELLEGGNQITCPSFKDLRGHVEHILNNPSVQLAMGEDGFEYAKKFTMERFNAEWIELIESIL